jgi:hypothetical protein
MPPLRIHLDYLVPSAAIKPLHRRKICYRVAARTGAILRKKIVHGSIIVRG